MKTFRHFWYLAFLRMINVLEESCTENQNTYFVSNNTFPKICTIYEIKSKNMVENEGTQMTSQYGAYALQLDWQRYMHLCACKHPRAWVPTCTHAPICNPFCFSTATVVSWTHFACLVDCQLILSHMVCIFTTVLQVAKFENLVACSNLTFHRPPLHLV